MMIDKIMGDSYLPYASPLCDLGKASLSLSFPICKRVLHVFYGYQPTSGLRAISKGITFSPEIKTCMHICINADPPIIGVSLAKDEWTQVKNL